MSFPLLVKVWICLSALATASGWILSALGALNRIGYLVVAGLALVCAGVWLLRIRGETARPTKVLNWPRLRWRFTHALPLCFAILAGLVLAGGLLYPPTNHTALSYRTPRVLHWLFEQHWHWIYTDDWRLNNRACGLEWMSAPMLLFARSDRWLFLLNYVPFLLLPGLIFSVFTRLGVNRRVAWNWMWILPAGYTFLLQAASAGNDTYPTIYALAAIDFGCRAWQTRKVSDLLFSVVSISLLTGAKASNMPLGLPWILLVLPLLPLLKTRPVASLAAFTVAALVSFLPTAVLNAVYCGDWTGLKLELEGIEMKSPVVGIWGNSLIFILHNFIPPFFPWAGKWNNSAMESLPQAIVQPMAANFEKGFHRLWELPTEDWVGLGFGVSALMVISLLALFRVQCGWATAANRRLHVPRGWRWAVMGAAWVALLVYCMKTGMVTGARLISPYYPLLLPCLLVPAGHAVLVRRRWWQFLAIGTMLLAIPVVILTPARPLWPAQAVFARLLEMRPGHPLLTRGLNAYTVYAQRSDPLAEVREHLPPGLETVGFMADPDDLDISLWRPFGSRRVKHIRHTDSARQIRERGIHYVVIGGAALKAYGTSLEEWVARTGSEVLASTTVTLKVGEGPQPWYVARLPSHNAMTD